MDLTHLIFDFLLWLTEAAPLWLVEYSLECQALEGTLPALTMGFDVRSTCIQWLVLYADSAATRSKQQLGPAANSVKHVS